ncbi:MAG TPA: TOBE domain-containing protein [Thermoplasmata archaeon]|nr:TOBE domain-containing protein [Thermoplasmata archaeon]HUJ77540.1 TOBE domain-containing protein [Thermoplasmata archaeon]
MTGPGRTWLTPADVALLQRIARAGSVVRASAELHVSRDRALYRLRKLAAAAGGPIVASTRGGAGYGGSTLTARGWRLLERGAEAAAPGPVATAGAGARLAGRYRDRPHPRVELPDGLSLAVGFRAAPGDRVRIAVAPESVLLARQRFATSARNVLGGTVERLRPLRGSGRGLVLVGVRVGRSRFDAAVTERSRRELALARGTRVVLYVKATAVRRVGGPAAPTRGSPRS